MPVASDRQPYCCGWWYGTNLSLWCCRGKLVIYVMFLIRRVWQVSSSHGYCHRYQDRCTLSEFAEHACDMWPKSFLLGDIIFFFFACITFKYKKLLPLQCEYIKSLFFQHIASPKADEWSKLVRTLQEMKQQAAEREEESNVLSMTAPLRWNDAQDLSDVYTTCHHPSLHYCIWCSDICFNCGRFHLTTTPWAFNTEIQYVACMLFEEGSWCVHVL